MLRQEFEYLTSNSSVAYPFVDEVTDPESLDGSPFSNLIVDAYLLDSDGTKDVKLTSVSDPSVSPVSVEFRYVDDSVAFTASDGESSAFGEYLIVEWHSDTASARLLFVASEVGLYAWPAAPTDAVLVASTVQPNVPAVNSVTAVLSDTLQFTLDGVIELESGFNVDIGKPSFNDTVTTNRGRNRLSIAVEPGAGLGKVPLCDQAQELRTINGIGPDDNGNFRLDADDCYRWELPRLAEESPGVWTIDSNKLTFYNQCEPCCQCSDYVDVYDNVMRDGYNKGKDASDALYGAVDNYKTLISVMEDEKACREKRWLEVRTSAMSGWLISVTVVLNNDGPCLLSDPLIEISMQTGASGVVVEGTSKIYNEEQDTQVVSLSGGFPAVFFDSPIDIKWTKKLVVEFSVYFPEGSGRVAGMPITVAAAGIVDGEFLDEVDITSYIPPPFNK